MLPVSYAIISRLVSVACMVVPTDLTTLLFFFLFYLYWLVSGKKVYRMQASHARGTFDTKSQNIRIWSNESRIQTRLFRVEASDKKKKDKIHVLDACRKKMVNGGAMNEFGAAREASFDPLGETATKSFCATVFVFNS